MVFDRAKVRQAVWNVTTDLATDEDIDDAVDTIEELVSEPKSIDRNTLLAEARLEQIRALCDGWSGDVDLADRIRAVLDGDPAPEVQALAVDFDTEFVLQDAVRVRGNSPQGGDRDTLLRYLLTEVLKDSIEQVADRILALVRPVEGVTLTPEEIADMRALIDITLQGATVRNEQFKDSLRGLAARLEEAQ